MLASMNFEVIEQNISGRKSIMRMIMTHTALSSSSDIYIFLYFFICSQVSLSHHTFDGNRILVDYIIFFKIMIIEQFILMRMELASCT